MTRLDRRDFIVWSIVSTVMLERLRFARAQDGGEGGEGESEGEGDGGDWGDWGDEGDDGADENGSDFGGDFDHWGGDYGDGANSCEEGPSLDALELSELEQEATESESAGPMCTDTGEGESSLGSFSQTVGDEGSVLDDAVEALEQAAEEMLEDFEEAFSSFMESAFACISVGGTETGTVTLGTCVTGTGDVYSTVGNTVSLGGVPASIEAGAVVNGSAGSYISGESGSVSFGVGSVGYSPSSGSVAVTVGAGDPGASYSEGTYQGNVTDMVRDAWNDMMQSGGEAMRSIEMQLNNMAQDPFGGMYR
jgi:hypothetical protein